MRPNKGFRSFNFSRVPAGSEYLQVIFFLSMNVEVSCNVLSCCVHIVSVFSSMLNSHG